MTNKNTVQLDLELVLPQAPDAADACVQRLVTELEGQDGMLRVHLLSANDSEPARICVHFDPQLSSLGRVRELVVAAGARLTQRFGHVHWPLQSTVHPRRSRLVEERLAALVGVTEARINPQGWARIEFNRELVTEPDLLLALEELGVPVGQLSAGVSMHGVIESAAPAVPAGSDAAVGRQDDHDHDHDKGQDHGHADHGHAHGGWLGPNAELYFALASGVALVAGYVLNRFSDAPAWAATSCYLLAYFFGGYFTLGEAWRAVRARRLEIDSLMLVAAAGAGALGAWGEGALLLFLFSLGHALEHYALGRAKRAIEALGELMPRLAEVLRDGQLVPVPVEQLVLGDTVLVRPNSRIAVDGFILDGSSSVDQAPVTGESVPVDKRAVADVSAAAAQPDRLDAEHRVFAGTINGSGVLHIQVTRLAADTVLARIVRMVSEAETLKSPTQRFTDRFERIFVPTVLGFVALLLFAWVVIDEPFRDSFYRAMAVLVAASPCALAIAIPSAVLSGVARAARGGVLVKGGGPLERLGSLGAIAFDKTGTLTEGKPRLSDVLPVDGASEQALLSVAIAVEAFSDHPLASAVVRDGTARLPADAQPASVTDVRSVTGQGVQAQLGAELVQIGKLAWFTQTGVAPTPAVLQACETLQSQGRTLMVVRQGDHYLGVLGLMDTPRESARQAIARLRAMGIDRMVMISGDHQRVAAAIAAQLGLDEAMGDLLPQDKVQAIQRLKQRQPVAMVGDGVNDAPALAHASVGIAMGGAGSDVALESAEVALMGDDLSTLPFAIALGRRTQRVIRQNLWMSLGMVAVLIPATVFGLQIGMAVALHEGSTLVVVANALRLLAFRPAD